MKSLCVLFGISPLLMLAVHFCGALPGTAILIGLSVGWLTAQIDRVR